MFNTIFIKQMITLIVIILIVFAITTTMFYFFMGDFVTKDKEAELERTMDIINMVMGMYQENTFYSNPAPLARIVDWGCNHNESIILLVRQDGQILYGSSSISLRFVLEDMIERMVEKDESMYLADQRQYERIFTNVSESAIRDIGFFYGLFTDTGSPWLTMQKRYFLSSINEQYAVSIHTPMPKVREAREGILQIELRALIISSLISIVIGLVFSSRLSSPIRKINEAAKVIAAGNFSERIIINSKDEIGELADTFNHMVLDLENLETMRREFVANVSHELRTPMTSIRGFIEGILDGTIPHENQEKYLRIVRDESVRLNRLVNNLLDMARMESGNFQLAVSNFNIVEVARRCVSNLARAVEEKDIVIKANFDGDRIFVEGDADGIERAIYNLLHNAVKFTEVGGNVEISVSEEKDLVRISVKDNGIGIDANDIEHIWQRFYKSDKSRGRDKSGTGIGLAIVKNIINEHHQKITVESSPGEGAKFEFTLKKADIQSLDDEAADL
ncbi:MAG: HAMP domain-containing histidine kinase [Oscillospiraceae bacterium]|nr:HAMP domain-containing histidine kinase [Oscillospiraceae bacterium]